MLGSLGIIFVSGTQGINSSGCLARRRFGGTSLLSWVARRATESELLDDVIVVMDSSRQELDLAGFAPTDIPVIYCDGADPVKVVIDAALNARCEHVVLIGVRNPFFDPELVDRLVASANEEIHCDYATYQSQVGRNSELGLVAEWYRVTALEAAAKAADEITEFADITSHIHSNPAEFSAKLIPVPQPLDRDDMRLAVNNEDDWERAEDILDALGTDRLDWRSIADLVDQHPTLRQPAGV